MHPFVARIKQAIISHSLFRPGSRLLVGVSGGGDSVALVHVLHELAREWRLHLRLLHVNHSLRGAESDADERFVKALAKQLSLPVICERLKLQVSQRVSHTSLEERCRQERYRCYLKYARRYRVDGIVLGHHKDDLAETVLMRMLRGAGPHGLHGFLPKSSYEGQIVLRPFYDVTRREIRDFLASHDISWREDSSNSNMRFLRNKVRAKLIPFLQKEFNPGIVNTLARTAQLMRMVEMLSQAIQAQQAGQLIKCAHNIFVYVSYYHIIVARLRVPRQIHKQVLLGKLFELLKQNMLLETVQPLLSSRTRTIPIQRSAFHRLNKPIVHKLNGWQISMKRVRATVSLRQRICRQANTTPLIQYYDIAELDFPLLIRSRRAGDRFQPFGGAGTQRLKQFLIDMKIPLYLRDYVPLLCDNQQILWVIGVRRGDTARIGPGSKHAIRVELSRLEKKRAYKKNPGM